jgi:hypothetical protein
MKIVNKPIKVMATSNTDGKIEPIKFRMDDKVVKIDKLIR